MIAGGVFNSGVLAAPTAGSTYDYVPVADERLARARAIAATCERHGTSLPAAALHFVASQPLITTLLIGARDIDEVRADVAMLDDPVDPALWAARQGRGLAPATLKSRIRFRSCQWRAPHDTMMNPPIEDLLDRSTPSSRLVTLAARRARQINSYFNQLGDGLGAIVPPQVTSVARKPLSIAFEEIAADKIVARRAARPEASEDAEADERRAGRATVA